MPLKWRYKQVIRESSRVLVNLKKLTQHGGYSGLKGNQRILSARGDVLWASPLHARSMSSEYLSKADNIPDKLLDSSIEIEWTLFWRRFPDQSPVSMLS